MLIKHMEKFILCMCAISTTALLSKIIVSGYSPYFPPCIVWICAPDVKQTHNNVCSSRDISKTHR